MVARFLARSRMAPVRCLSGDVLVGWEDVAVGLVYYKFGVLGLGGGDV